MTNMFNMGQQNLQHTPTVNSAQLEWLFIHILRVPSIFSEAERTLTVDLFDKYNESQFMVLWSTLVAMRAAATPITYQSLYYELQSRIANDLDREIPPGHADQLMRQDRNGLLFLAFGITEDQLVPNSARGILQQFLAERRVLQPLRNVLQKGTNRTVISNFRGLIESAMSELRTIATINEAPMSKGMPEIGAELPPPIPCEPTTLSFIDPWIIGQRKGDLNGILGGTGSGKSTLGVQIAVTMARNYYSQYSGAPGQKKRLSVFLSYEEPEKKINTRIWACAADIRQQKLKDIIEQRNWGLLSNQTNIEQYELDLPGNNGANGMPILSETDRWNMCRTWLNEHFVLLDMSGADAYPAAGRGFVPEIKAVLERLVAERNAEIGTFVVDYAGLVCKRHMLANNIGEEQLRYKLAGIGDRLRTEVTEPLGATGWLLHQIAGSQTNHSPTKLITHGDASESKSFAENMAVCGCLGTKDRATGVMLCNWSKVRYTLNPDMHMPRIRINSEFSRMEDVSDQMVLSETGDGFIDPTTRNSLSGGTQINPVRTQQRPRTIGFIDPMGGD